jgi:hypothetical protein
MYTTNLLTGLLFPVQGDVMQSEMRLVVQLLLLDAIGDEAVLMAV